MNNNTRKSMVLPWAKCLLAFQAVAIVLGLASCGSPVMKNITKQLPPLDNTAEVTVYDREDSIPEKAEVIGGLVILPAWKKNWETGLSLAKQAARSAGGNSLEIQTHAYPVHNSRSGHLISAFILNINDSIEPAEPVSFKRMDFHDYVVTKEGDSIPCAIVYETTSHLQFVHGYNKQGYRKSISLPKSDLLCYHIEDPKTFEENQKRNKVYTMRFAVNGGGSIRVNGFGFNTSVDFLYNINRAMYLGIYYNYNYGKTSYNQPNWGYNYGYTKVNSLQQIHFIAGSVGVLYSTSSNHQIIDSYLDGACELKPSMTKHRFHESIFLGYIIYAEEGETNGNYFSITGNTVGIGLYLGYDYMLTQHLSIGIANGVLMGIPFKVKVNDNEMKTIIPSCIDFSAGLRYYL